MKSSALKKIIILVTVFLVPGFLYYLLQAHGKNTYVTLPHFGPKQALTSYHTKRGKKIFDTLYHQAGSPKLINENGDSVKMDTAHIYIAGLFYTNGGYAEKMTKDAMVKLFNVFNLNQRISFLSITLDPLNDTAERLKLYRQQLKLAPGNWTFLTGDETTIYQWVKEGLLLDVVKTDDKITYNNMLILMDHKHTIRGYYDVTSKDAMAKLDDEIRVLMAEELRNIRDGR